MLRIQTCSLLLVLCAGSLEAWLWYKEPEPTTETSTETTATTSAATTASATTMKEGKVDGTLSGVGEEIISVATGIRKFVETWDGTPTTWTTSRSFTEKVESAKPNVTDETGRFREGRVDEGSGVVGGNGSGSRADIGSVVKIDVSRINVTVASASPCLPVPSDWPVCKRPNFFTLPNFFNHTSVEEVRAVLDEWAWLVRAGCHHSAEWFLCLLLAPRCPSPAAPLLLPCRGFCHVLQDSCWASLENGRLPVECDHLPETAQEPGRPACASVSNWKGNPSGLECILCGDTFRIRSIFVVFFFSLFCCPSTLSLL